MEHNRRRGGGVGVGRSEYLKNGDPRQPYVVEWDGSFERVADTRVADSVVLIPVDARIVGGGVVAERNSRGIALSAVVNEQRKLDAFRHAVRVARTADEVDLVGSNVGRRQDDPEQNTSRPSCDDRSNLGSSSRLSDL